MKKIIFISILVFFNFINANSEVKPILVGDTNSKVKLMVFESLTCSFCANFHKNIYPKLKEDFIDKGLISIEFKSFPLDIIALNATKLAHCRNDGKHEILHHLYLNQDKWIKGKTELEANMAMKMFLDTTDYNLDFDKCLADKKIEDHILEDRIEGVKKYKVNATPTVIINGKKFENHSNYKKLKKYIEKLI
ncbi:DsbA family protein [Candidatus Pelagibacter sp.]|nr:DsbA family protein [Candidatus Pelagibacter sp.]